MSERVIVPVERTRAGKRLLEELSESPMPGARYAVDVVSRRLRAIEEEAAAAERDRMPVDDVDFRTLLHDDYEFQWDDANVVAAALTGEDLVVMKVNRAAWHRALSDPATREASDAGLADVAAGRVRPLMGLSTSPVTIAIEPAVTLLAARWYRPLVMSRTDGSVQVQFEDIGPRREAPTR